MDYAAVAKGYARSVVAGKIPANKWVKLACQRQLDDLERFKGRDSPYIFNPVLIRKNGNKYRPGDNICYFLECLPHVKGPLGGQSIKLEPWQIFRFMAIFGWIVRKTGKRRFRRAYTEVPRGNAKSTESSCVGLYMLAADGEIGAECYSLATTKDQAKLVFNPAQEMMKSNKELREKLQIEVSVHSIYQESTGSRFKALSSRDDSLDGLNIHFGCIDELHAHKTRGIYDVVETATGKRDNSLLWVITTAGSNRSGICYEVRNYITKILSGEIQDDSQFGIIYGIDEEDDWTQEEALKKANPNWGISVQKEVILALQKKAVHTTSAVNNFLTKHLNVWVSANTAWMNMTAWDACTDVSLNINNFTSKPCWIGLDLASKIDVAAMAMVFETESGYAIFMKFYLPDNAVQSSKNSQYSGWAREGLILVTPGDVLDFNWIEADILDAKSRFDVREVAFDPWQATQLSQNMLTEGVPMVEVGATVKNFSEPMKNLDAIVRQCKLAHDGNPVMTWMISNVVAHTDIKENIYPRKELPENKIDGPVALIMALSRILLTEPYTIGENYDMIVF